MEYRKLGRTGLEISAIGLGTMTWGVQNSEAEGFQQMDYALARGINFFDTAEMYAIPPCKESYGTTETIIGNWFSQHPSNREKVILATKMTGPGLAWIRAGSRMDRNTLRQAVDGSLKRLQTDYIDLYQLHWPNRGSYHFGKTWNFAPCFDAEVEQESFLKLLHTLDELIKAGKIRHFGLSNETAWGMTKWLQLADHNALPRAAAIQNEYSLLCRHFEPDLCEIALTEQCGLLAWSPLVRGMISGKYLNGARPAGARLTIETRVEHRIDTQCDAAIEKYIGLASQFDLDVCQMAIAFVKEKPFVSSVLIGATDMRQLKNNIDAAEITLSAEINQEIEKIRREYPVPF